jgi:hypothetical protein
MSDKPITTTLENWYLVKGLNNFVGNIHNDIRKRWPDGRIIHTSYIDDDKVKLSEYEEGDIIETQNSIYKLGKPGK